MLLLLFRLQHNHFQQIRAGLTLSTLRGSVEPVMFSMVMPRLLSSLAGRRPCRQSI